MHTSTPSPRSLHDWLMLQSSDDRQYGTPRSGRKGQDPASTAGHTPASTTGHVHPASVIGQLGAPPSRPAPASMDSTTQRSPTRVVPGPQPRPAGRATQAPFIAWVPAPHTSERSTTQAGPSARVPAPHSEPDELHDTATALTNTEPTSIFMRMGRA